MAVDQVGYSMAQRESQELVMTHARRHRFILSPWMIWIGEVVVALVIAGGLGGMVIPRLRGAMEWARYRATIRELTTTIHSTRWRALSQHRAFELRADPAHGSFQLVAMEKRPHRGGIVEQTIWLPRGLQIIEAPARLTIGPTGHMSTAHVTIAAPLYNREFHLSTDEAGTVRCDEEPGL